MVIVFDFGPQPVHGHGEGMIIDEISAAVPETLQKKLAGENPPGILRQRLQKLVFVGGDGQLFSAAAGFSC